MDASLKYVMEVLTIMNFEDEGASKKKEDKTPESEGDNTQEFKISHVDRQLFKQSTLKIDPSI